MRKLKNSHKIFSFVLLGIFLISIIIFPNTNIVSENNVYDNTPIFPSEQTNQNLDNTIDTTRPQVSASVTKDNETFSISQSENDAFSHAFFYAQPYTNYDSTNITLGIVDKDDPDYYFISNGIALRWNITVPKLAHITKAYINLTIANLTSGGMPWTGFNTSISAFDQASTNNFSNPDEKLRYDRPLMGDILWELDGTEFINQTLQTVDISDLLQQVKALDGWDGIFGAFIQPGIGTDYNIALELYEAIQFWAYDYGKPEYYPKLYIEWDDTPYFTDTPEDTYVVENAPRFSLQWQVWDNDPARFKIICNESILDNTDYKDWISGWFTYNLPALERGFYNFTAYFNDTDGHLIWDSVIVEAGPIAQMTYKIERSEDDAWYKPQKPAFNHIGNLVLGGSDNKDSVNQRVICLRFNTAIPKHVRIKSAYVNLTVSSVSGSNNGLTSEIHMFYPPVLDFSDEYDNDLFTQFEIGSYIGQMMFYRPTSDSSVTWAVPDSLSEGNTIQTLDFASELQEIIDFGNYDGYIGLYIIPTDNVDSINEKVNIYSYDSGNPEYYPTLFVEWEESPYFVSTPANIAAKNGIRGYNLEWTATDDNPTTFTITCNKIVSNIPYEGVWQSGIENSHNWFWRKIERSTTKIRYDLPPLDIGVYNFTIRINDAYGNYNLDSVIVTVSDFTLPVLTDIKFIQNGKEVDYFQCGNGPFTVRIYNNTDIDPEIWLTAYYPGYNQIIYSVSTTFGTYYPTEVTIIGDSNNILKYGPSAFSYNPALGCYEFNCPQTDGWAWYTYVKPINNAITSIQQEKKVINIEYNLLNRFLIRINDIGQYIYNQTIYGGDWARPLEVWNRDLTPPTYLEPQFIEPDEPDKHYEVNIWASAEAYGAAVASVFLYYSVDDGSWEETEMILKDGKYYGEIPAQEEGSTIDYYIKITDIAGNIIETEIYHEKAPTFEEPSIIIPIVGILLGILGSLSIVAIYRHKRKAAFKMHPSEKSPIKSKKGMSIGNKLLQKIKKVRKKQ